MTAMSPSAQDLPGAERPIRVLGWPAFANRGENPYNWLLYTHLARLGVRVEEFSTPRFLLRGASILHMHWAPTARIRGPRVPGVLARAGGLLALLEAAKRRGVRVVWTAHNLESRDRKAHPELERRFWRVLPRYLDGLLCLSPSNVEILRERYPALRGVPAFVTPHGHYRGAYPMETGRAEARARLGLAPGARVVAFVGQMRPYKDVLALLRAFAEVDDPQAVLLLAGMQRMGAQTEEFEARVARDPRVRVVPRFVPDDELQTYFAAADLVALPFREVLNSGSAILALSFDRPVLVPREGSLADLETEVGREWVMGYEGELTGPTLAAALESARGREGASAPLGHLDWPRVAEQTLAAYRSVLGMR
jgi:beta-1,4-mannosyltransferase